VYAVSVDALRLLAALEGLVDVQNGPPLVRDAGEWERAMAAARDAIAAARRDGEVGR